MMPECYVFDYIDEDDVFDFEENAPEGGEEEDDD
jgi:hypothetical protein